MPALPWRAFCSQVRSGKESSAVFGGAVSGRPVTCREDELCQPWVAFCPTPRCQTAQATLVPGAGEPRNPPPGLVLPPRAKQGLDKGASRGRQWGGSRSPQAVGAGDAQQTAAPTALLWGAPGVLPPGVTRGSQPQPTAPCRVPVRDMGPYKIPCPAPQRRGQSHDVKPLGSRAAGCSLHRERQVLQRQERGTLSRGAARGISSCRGQLRGDLWLGFCEGSMPL